MRNLHPSHNDDPSMRAPASRYNDRKVEALLAGHGEPDDADLLTALHGLRRLSSSPAPEPSSALAAVLSGAAPLPLVAAPPLRSGSASGGRQRLRTAAFLVVAGLGATTAGAAANALPAPAQRATAKVLNTVTPFHFPSPHAASGRPVAPPTTAPATTPGPADARAPQRVTTTPSRDGEQPEQGRSPLLPYGSQESRTSDGSPDAAPQDKPTSGSGTTDGIDQEPQPASDPSQPRPVTTGAADPSAISSAEPSSDPSAPPSDPSDAASPEPVS
jgi:hypothetical protein